MIKPEDLKIDIYRGTPDLIAGSNYVRIIHLPTKIVVISEDNVPANVNTERALKLLEAKYQERFK